MKFVYLLPFSYFVHTRLSKGSLEFHALFEWGAALVLTGAFGVAGTWGSMLFALEAYFAFISLYEVGYLFNDLISTKREFAARLRGPADATPAWLAAWVSTRLMAFTALTLFLDVTGRGDWWLFFGAMLAVFALHNLLQDKEFEDVHLPVAGVVPILGSCRIRGAVVAANGDSARRRKSLRGISAVRLFGQQGIAGDASSSEHDVPRHLFSDAAILRDSDVRLP